MFKYRLQISRVQHNFTILVIFNVIIHYTTFADYISTELLIENILSDYIFKNRVSGCNKSNNIIVHE